MVGSEIKVWNKRCVGSCDDHGVIRWGWRAKTGERMGDVKVRYKDLGCKEK